jgi:YD repeat-containing protein
MKSYLVTILCALVTTAVSAMQPAKNDVGAKGLVGKVKIFHTDVYKAEVKPGTIAKGRKMTDDTEQGARITFNEAGYKTEDIRYGQHDAINARLTYAYDEKWYVTNETRYNSGNKEERQSNFVNKYDADGKIIQRNKVNGDIISNVTTYKYDESGKLVEKSGYENNPGSPWKITYAYDAQGNIKETTEDYGDKKTWRVTYKNDEKGNPVEETTYLNGKFVITYKYVLDEHGNRTKFEWCKANGKVYAAWTFQYEYDRNGNWIKAIEINTDKISPFSSRDNYIFERQIEYF